MYDSTGLIFLRARYYAPWDGRFQTRDSWDGDARRPLSFNGWLYVHANPVNFTDPSGYCVFCKPGDMVRVDARPDREIAVYSEPGNSLSDVVGYVSDNQTVEIIDSFGGKWSWADKYVYRKVRIHRVTRPLPPELQSFDGWIANIRLLDNCQGPPGKFGCLPIEDRNIKHPYQGFGPTQYAYNICHGQACIYSALRGLHNGIDFIAGDGAALVWGGTTSSRIEYTYPGDSVFQYDASDPGNFAIPYAGAYVLYGHQNNLFVGKGQTIRSGQTIGAQTGGHLHFSVRTMEYKYNNPLNYFVGRLQESITSRMEPYFPGYTPYSMKSFDTSSGNGSSSFWNDCPDLTGIVWGYPSPPY
jgi:RHS repeat-associated protein